MTETFDELEEARDEFVDELEDQGWECEDRTQGGVACEKEYIHAELEVDYGGPGDDGYSPSYWNCMVIKTKSPQSWFLYGDYEPSKIKRTYDVKGGEYRSPDDTVDPASHECRLGGDMLRFNAQQDRFTHFVDWSDTDTGSIAVSADADEVLVDDLLIHFPKRPWDRYSHARSPVTQR